MPLLVELPEAGIKLKNNFNKEILAEQMFSKTEVLGDFVSNGFSINDQFPATIDSDPVVKTFNNFTINEGHVVTPSVRCKGMYLFIEGDLIVNGILSMTARGAKAPGKFIGIDPYSGRIYFDSIDRFSARGLITLPNIGGAGANRVYVSSPGAIPDQHRRILGNPGEDSDLVCGGGGCGGAYSSHGGTIYSGAGTTGTSFSGGAGGGGAACINANGNGYSAAPDGGAGGPARLIGTVGGLVRGIGGGAGNNGGARYSSNGGGATAGLNGTGGLMILVVRGNIIFGPNGKIEAKGMNGGYGESGGGGGASGGGAIHLFSKSTDIDLSKIDVSGGIGGVGGGYSNGGNGGSGAKKLYRLIQ